MNDELRELNVAQQGRTAELAATGPLAVNGVKVIRAYLRYDYAGVQLRLIEVVTELDSQWQPWMMDGSLLIEAEILLDLKAAMARAEEMERRLVHWLDLSQQSRPVIA